MEYSCFKYSYHFFSVKKYWFIWDRKEQTSTCLYITASVTQIYYFKYFSDLCTCILDQLTLFNTQTGFFFLNLPAPPHRKTYTLLFSEYTCIKDTLLQQLQQKWTLLTTKSLLYISYEELHTTKTFLPQNYANTHYAICWSKSIGFIF